MLFNNAFEFQQEEIGRGQTNYFIHLIAHPNRIAIDYANLKDCGKKQGPKDKL